MIRTPASPSFSMTSSETERRVPFCRMGAGIRMRLHRQSTLLALFVLVVSSSIPRSADCQANPPGWWEGISLPSGPSVRYGHTAIYDSRRGRMLLFGGKSGSTFFNEVWQLSLGCPPPQWSPLNPSGGPPEKRAFHSAIYDSLYDRVIVFGGEGEVSGLLQDTWELRLSTMQWDTLQTSGTRPCKRSGHAAIFAPAVGVRPQRMLLFAGIKVPLEAAAIDTWELTLPAPGTLGGGVWSQVSKTDAGAGCLCTSSGQLECDRQPEARAFGAAIYDPRMCDIGIVGQPDLEPGRMLLSSGCDPQDGNPIRDLHCYAWGHDIWSVPLNPGVPPDGRFGHTAVRDLVRGNRMLVFGGASGVSDCSFSSSAHNQLWWLNLDSHSWGTHPIGSPFPTARYFHSAIYDPIYDQMVVFGGRTSSGASLNDLWMRDFMPPAAISNLAVHHVGKKTVLLSWTAPGDDGNCGTAAEYDLRYSTTGPITESNFYSAQRVGAWDVPIPGPAGTFHSCVGLDSLAQCTWHYFAIKTRDAGNQWSPISNTPVVQTKCSGSDVYCNDGGLFAHGWIDGTWATENSLFWDPGTNLPVDLYRMRVVPSQINGGYLVRLIRMGGGPTDIDQLSLGTVDHDPSVSAFASGSLVFLGTTAAVQEVRDAAGTDVTLLVNGAGGYLGVAGQSLMVTLGGSAIPNRVLAIESSGFAPGAPVDSTGILIQAQGIDGTWGTLAHVYPRRDFDAYAVDVGGNAVVRLLFLRDHTIKSLRRVNVTETQVLQPLDLVQAGHSRFGDVSAAVRSIGGASTYLLSGDTLRCSFTAIPVLGGKVRDLFLQARGPQLTQPLASRGDPVSRAPQSTFEFNLAPPQPNPSAGQVDLSFSMAESGPVSIRIYDVAGRLIKTLVNEVTDAGSHLVPWDATDENGRRVSPGVYYCRMLTGAGNSQRKLIFLQR